MSGAKKVTVGYKYYIGAHMILCHGEIDNISQIYVDNRLAWSGTSTGGAISINSPNLFGGEKREGGVSGTIDLEMGASTQTKNSYLTSQLGSDIPAFRGVVGLVLRQVYIGMNPYLKQWRIRGKRIQKLTSGLTQWYSAKAAIGNDINPAHIIRECLTDTTWGMGYSSGDIDDVSFAAAADKLYSESFGLSLLWDKAINLDEFITNILKHIDGSLYVDRATGKFKLTLSRADYVIGSLLNLNEDNISRIENFNRKTISELNNQVTVIYWDITTGKDNSITVQDISLVQQQGTTIGTQIQYPGITNSTLASKVAARDLKALSTPLARCTVYANRAASSLNVGDVFKLTFAKYGISQIIMRVANIEFGALDNNIIKIDCVEDVFALGSAIYTPPPASSWVSPLVEPTACPFHSVTEATYYEMAQRVGDDDAQAIPATAGYIIATGVRPNYGTFNASINNDLGSGYEEAGTTEFCPTATLNGAISITETTVPINNAIDVDQVNAGTYAILNLEIIRVDSISSTSMTIARGCLDTVPVAHNTASRIYFIDEFCESNNVEYADGEVAKIKLTPISSLGELAIGSAPEQTVTIDARHYKPYAPGKLRLNGNAYPASIADGIDLVVTWAHRDRLLQTASVIDTEASSIGPEAGTTYSVYLYNASNTLISSQTGISGTTHTFTNATMGANYGNLTVKLKSVRDGIDSLQMHSWTFTRLSP